MASGGKEQATFSINLDGNASEGANEAAEAMENLRARIAGGDSAIKEMGAALRRLRGSTLEVKDAKAELAAKIQAERAAVSSATLEMLKAGTSYEKVAASTKKLTEEQKSLVNAQRADQSKALSSSISAAGGPVAELRDKIGGLKEMFGAGNAGAALLTVGCAALVAAIAAVSAAAVAGAIALGKWVLESANAARTQNLVREAVTGSAASAKNLGDHIADLSGKLSTSKEKLQELALSLAKTRLSGQAIVDTFNLVGQAGDAMGDEVAGKLKDITTRMQLIQRFQLNPLELVGTGLEFKDVAASLAKQMGVGVNQAKRSLAEGRVTLDAGAKALRDAVEKRFAEINARKALDINVQVTKLGDAFRAMTRDIKLEPLVKAIADIAHNFDESTVTGAALKEIITNVGNALSSGFKDAAPVARKVIQGLVIGALEAEIAWLRLRIALRDTFGKDILKDASTLSLALDAAKVPGEALALTLGSIEHGLRVLAALGGGAKDLWTDIGKAWDSVAATLKNAIGTKTLDLGKDIVRGLVDGMKSGVSQVADAAKDLANAAKNGIKEALGIHSPSKVAFQLGAFTGDGMKGGLESKESDVGDAGAAVGDAAAGGLGGASSGRGGGSTIAPVFHFHIGAGASPAAVQGAKEAAPGMAAEFLKILEDLARQGGGALS